MGVKRERQPFQALRDVSPGWGRYYAGLWSLWMVLPLAWRWVLGLVFLAVAAWRAWA